MKIPVEMYLENDGYSWDLVFKVGDKTEHEYIAYGRDQNQPDMYQVLSAFQDMMYRLGHNTKQEASLANERLDNIRDSFGSRW